MTNAARGRRGIWPLAKLVKTRSHFPPTPLLIPDLVTTSGHASTPSEKAEAMKAQFYPPMPDVDLYNIINISYPPEMSSPMSISEAETPSVIKKLHPFKAAGSDGIPFFVLKCLKGPLISYLKPRF